MSDGDRGYFTYPTETAERIGYVIANVFAIALAAFFVAAYLCAI